MTPSARMRWATPADAEVVAAYQYECWKTAFAPLVELRVMEAVEPRVQRFADWFTPGSDVVTVVAVDDGDAPIGHTSVSGPQLLHLFVDPKHQGEGLGRQLLAVGERLIRRAGHDEAELHTIVGNTPAITLYQSCGWDLTDETVDDVMPNGASFTEHVMRKPLDNAGHVSSNRQVWDDDAPDWVDRGRRSWAREPHWGEMAVSDTAVDALPAMTGKRVIELGCGTGYVSSWCLRAGAESVIGLDNSREQLRGAQLLQGEFEMPFPLVWADAERLPVADDSFDVALSEYGAALWCDPYRWIPEAARVLRPGGKLMFVAWSTLMSVNLTQRQG